jgi:hypothetical protein
MGLDYCMCVRGTMKWGGGGICLMYEISLSVTFLESSYHLYHGVSAWMLKMTHKRKRAYVQNILYSSSETLNT